jgi:hypothetical protein
MAVNIQIASITHPNIFIRDLFFPWDGGRDVIIPAIIGQMKAKNRPAKAVRTICTVEGWLLTRGTFKDITILT